MSEDSTPDADAPPDARVDRRAFLGVSSALATGAVTGCLQDDGGDGGRQTGTPAPGTATDGQAGGTGDTASRFDAIEADLQELQGRLSDAEADNVPVEYQRTNLGIVEQFVRFGREDLERDVPDRAAYIATELEKLLAQTDEQLSGLVDGSREGRVTPRFTTSEVSTEDYHFRAERTIRSEDRTEEGPVFFNGFMGFTMIDDTLFESDRAVVGFDEMGLNVVTSGTANSVGGFVERDENTERGYSFNTDQLERLQKQLDAAAENDLAFTLLPAIHGVPDFAFELWPDLESDGTHWGIDIFHPEYRELIEYTWGRLFEEIGDHEALHSIILTNEPKYYATTDERSRRQWAEYLDGRYGSLDELERVHDADYESFESVPMPNLEGMALYPVEPLEASPRVYDWVRFNNQRFAAWHEWLDGIVAEAAPDVETHIKVNQRGLRHGNPLLVHGVDYEDYSAITDVHGNDNHAKFEDTPHTYRQFLKLYDLQTSFGEKPVYDSESKFQESNAEYAERVPLQYNHYHTASWQGTVHGRSASQLWIWEREYEDEDDSSFGDEGYRPDATAGMAHANLDMNRLAEEMVALQNVDPRVAILYSPTAQLYAKDHLTTKGVNKWRDRAPVYQPGDYMGSVDVAYDAISFYGTRAGFVSESQIAEGKLADYDLFVLPMASHVPREAFAGIVDYVDQGGDVVAMGDTDRLVSRDGYDRAHPEDRRQTIMDAATHSPADASVDEARATIRSRLDAHGLPEVMVQEAGADGPPQHVEWRTADHDGRKLVNVANYSRKSRELQVLRDDTPVTDVPDLLNTETLDGKRWEIPGLRTRLLALE